MIPGSGGLFVRPAISCPLVKQGSELFERYGPFLSY
jgi:hypothetical protein